MYKKNWNIFLDIFTKDTADLIADNVYKKKKSHLHKHKCIFYIKYIFQRYPIFFVLVMIK